MLLLQPGLLTLRLVQHDFCCFELLADLIQLLLKCDLFVFRHSDFIDQHAVSSAFYAVCRLVPDVFSLCAIIRLKRDNLSVRCHRRLGHIRMFARQRLVRYVQRPVFQGIDVQTPLAQDEGAGRTAPPGITTHDIGGSGIQVSALIPQCRQRHIGTAFNSLVLEFAGQPHIQPPGAVPDQLLRCGKIHFIYHGLTQQLVKIIPGEPHQRAVSDHHHRCVAPGS